jgi:hypothetical protein
MYTIGLLQDLSSILKKFLRKTRIYVFIKTNGTILKKIFSKIIQIYLSMKSDPDPNLDPEHLIRIP